MINDYHFMIIQRTLFCLLSDCFCLVGGIWDEGEVPSIFDLNAQFSLMFCTHHALSRINDLSTRRQKFCEIFKIFK